MSAVFQLQRSVGSGRLNREAVVPKAQHTRASPLRAAAAFPRGDSAWDAGFVSFCAPRTALGTDCPCSEVTQRIRGSWLARWQEWLKDTRPQSGPCSRDAAAFPCCVCRRARALYCITSKGNLLCKEKKGVGFFSSTEENAAIKKYRLLRKLRIG